MTMTNFSEKTFLADHRTWKTKLISAIECFQKRYKVLPSYILANDYTHSLIDLWINVSNNSKEDARLTHFIYNGNFIELVFDSKISNQTVELQYDSFFEMENMRQKYAMRKQKKKVVA